VLCPVCNKEMLVLEFELVEIDHCAECGGVWLDSGELALIGKRAGALHGNLLAALESGQGEPDQAQPKRRCPVCRNPLLRTRADSPSDQARERPEGTRAGGPFDQTQGRPEGTRMGGAANFQVEKCPRGDGLWFEGGSLQTVIQAAGADSGNVFVRFLADIHARRGSAKLEGRSSSSQPVS
jgi:Zn-finger nucleic acid-binding protein